MKGSRENLHAGHRDRLRKRFIEEGLDAFEDHQALELLLFFALPRRDTNELAHGLLRRYGSLSAVLDADPVDLARTEGIGETAASLLSLVPALTRRYADGASPNIASTTIKGNQRSFDGAVPWRRFRNPGRAEDRCPERLHGA
jgi:DNA repair protein RadC